MRALSVATNRAMVAYTKSYSGGRAKLRSNNDRMYSCKYHLFTTSYDDKWKRWYVQTTYTCNAYKKKQ